MVATRSRAHVSETEPDNNAVDKDVSTGKKDRQIDLLADLVKTGRRMAKKAKTKIVNANDEEKDPAGSLDLSTYVDSGTKSEEKIQNNEDGERMVTNGAKTEVTKAASSVNNQPNLSKGRGGGLFGRFKKGDKGDRLGEIEVEMKKTKSHFFLDQHTESSEICSWPIQALVQVLLKIDDTTFGIAKENLTKYNPKFLRRLVIEMRNDLKKAGKDISLDTTIRNKTGVFSIDTKLWELQAYDTMELRMILEAYMQQEELFEEKAKVPLMKGELVRQLLIGMQNKMIEAEVAPYNIYLEFEFFRHDIQQGIETFGYSQDEEENWITQEDLNIILPSERESERNENNSLVDDEFNIDKEVADAFPDLEWIKLNKETPLDTICRWSGYINFSLIMEWYETHHLDFYEELFQTMSSSELRYQVVQLQQYLMEDDEKVVISVRNNEKYTMSKDTRDWEIMALDETDLRAVYMRHCQMINVEAEEKTSDEMYSVIMDANEKMNSGDMKNIAFLVNLNTTFDHMECHLNVQEYRLNKKEVSLSSFTLREEILTWCNKTLITMIAKVMDKYGLVMKDDLKIISPKVLRKYLLGTIQFLKLSNEKEIFKSAVANLGIYNRDILDWEIENLSIKEMRIILQADTLDPKNKTKWRGCWSKSKLKNAIKEMRTAYKDLNIKGGIRFQSEEGSNEDLIKFIQGIRIGNVDTLDTNIRDHLMKCKMCTSGEQAQKTLFTATNEENHENEENVNIAQQDNRKPDINLTVIQEKTKEIEQNSMFEASDAKLDSLTKAAKVTPMKNLAPKGKLKKGTKAIVGKANRKKSARLEKKASINYDEEDNMSIEGQVKNNEVEITADTEDWQIREMDLEMAKRVYLKCMEKRNLKLSDKDIEELTKQDLVDNLFLAREQEREIQGCLQDMEEHEKAEQKKIEEKNKENEVKDPLWNVNENAATHANQQVSQQTEDTSKTDNKRQKIDAAQATNMDIEESSGNQITNGAQMHDKLNAMSRTSDENEQDKKMDVDESVQNNRGDQTSKTVDAGNHDSNNIGEETQMETEQGIVEQSTSMEVEHSVNEKTNDVKMKHTKKDTYHMENNVANGWQRVLTKQEKKDQQNGDYQVPFSGLRGQPADNLLGMQVNEFTPAQEAIQNEDKNSPVVVTQEQNIYILRVNLATNTRATNHVPTFVKKFVRVLRTADATIKVLPFDKNNTNENDIITNEKDFPDTEDQIKKWAVGVKKTRFQKLQFSIKVAMTEKFGTLKDKIYDWCGKNACWVFFNNIDAENIFRAGWIQGLHPFFHNKNKVKDILTRGAPHLKERISVYTRNVVQSHFDEKKTKTVCEAIAVDGDHDYKNEILKMLCEAQRGLSAEYSEARFFPFRRNTYLNAEDQIIAMKSQNEYNDTTNVKDVAVTNPQTEYDIINQEVRYTFTNWISKFQVNGKELFSEVEVTDLGKVRLIYKSNFEPQVCELLANLYTHTVNAFGSVVGKNLLGDENIYIKKKDLHSAESSHAYQCAQHFRSLPKSTGKASSSRMKKPQRSYAQVTNSNQGGDDQEQNSNKQNSTEINSTGNANEDELHDQIAELSQTVNELKEQVAQTNKAENVVDSSQEYEDIQNKVEEQRKEFMDQLEEVKKDYKKDLKDTERNLVDMIDKKEEKFTKQLVGLKEFFKTSMKDTENKANERADAQKQTSDKILAILLGRQQGISEPPNVVEPKACSHYGAVR